MKIRIIIVFLVLCCYAKAQESNAFPWTNMSMHEDKKIRCAIFSSTGRYLAFTLPDYRVYIMNMETGKIAFSLAGHVQDVNCLAFSNDERLLASGGRDKVIKIWSVKKGAEFISLIGHSAGISSLAFTPDGKILVSGGEDSYIRLWSVDQGKEIQALSAHSDDVTNLSFNPDGSILLSRSRNNIVKFWEIKRGRQGMVNTELQDPTFYHNRGNSRKALRDYLGAMQDFKKTIELDSKNVNAYIELACVNALLAENTENKQQDPNIASSLHYLEQAIKNGYDLTAVEKNPDLNVLRSLSEYQKLVTVETIKPVDNTTPSDDSGRTISFKIMDSSGIEVPAYEILVDGKKITTETRFAANKSYNFEIRFAGYKTVKENIHIYPGKEPQMIYNSLSALKRYEFSTREDELLLNGLKYDYIFYADSQPIEPHLIEVNNSKVFFNYSIYLDPQVKYLQIVAGYLTTQKRLFELDGTVKRLDQISIPGLVFHIERLAKENTHGRLSALEALENLLKSSYWGNRIRSIPSLELLPLLENVEKWEFEESDYTIRTRLLVDVLRQMIENK